MIRNKGRRTYPRGTVMRFLIETIVSDTGLADLMVGRNGPDGVHLSTPNVVWLVWLRLKGEGGSRAGQDGLPNTSR